MGQNGCSRIVTAATQRFQPPPNARTAARSHKLALGDRHRGTLAREKRGLLRRHLEIACRARPILIHRNIQRALRRSGRGLLPLRFLLEQPLGREIVFNILQGRQHRLAIDSHRGVVACDGLRLDRVSLARIEQGQCQSRAQRTRTAWATPATVRDV